MTLDDLGLSPEFLADEDIARDEDEWDAWHGAPKCGGPVYEGREQVGGCPGCRHCDPPDHECKPYGWGIERFEDPALARANEAMWAEIDRRGGCKYTSAVCGIETWGLFAGRWSGPRPTDADVAFRDLCWRVWTSHNPSLERAARRKWDRLCDCCQTHRQAVERYSRWAERVTGRTRAK